MVATRSGPQLALPLVQHWDTGQLYYEGQHLALEEQPCEQDAARPPDPHGLYGILPHESSEFLLLSSASRENCAFREGKVLVLKCANESEKAKGIFQPLGHSGPPYC